MLGCCCMGILEENLRLALDFCFLLTILQQTKAMDPIVIKAAKTRTNTIATTPTTRIATPHWGKSVDVTVPSV